MVTGQLEEENREKVREALLIRHHHQNNDIDILRHIRSFADFRKDRSSTHQKKADSFDDSTSLQHELEVPHPTMGGKTLLVSRGWCHMIHVCVQEHNGGRNALLSVTVPASGL